MNIQEYLKNSIAPDKKFPEFRPGDTVRVYYKTKEGDRERIQRFEGVVISKRGKGLSKTFTVRRVKHGFGVERIFPLYSPNLEKIEILRHGKVRRAKLYYLRGQPGKIRIKERQTRGKNDTV